MIAAFTFAIGGDFFIGEDGTEGGTPVDGYVAAIDETMGVDDFGLGVCVEFSPGSVVGVVVVVGAGMIAGLKFGDEFGDGASTG